MLARELENVGITTVVITALPTIAAHLGAGRILRGTAIAHPVGDPSLAPEDETDLRLLMLSRAIEMLETDLPRGTIWEIE